MPKTKRAKDKNAAARREFEKFLRSGGETFFISGGLLMLSKSAEPLQVIAELLQLAAGWVNALIASEVTAEPKAARSGGQNT